MADAAFSTSPPTEGHIRSTAWLCLAIFRKHGMRSAMNMLLEAARQFIPVTRINGVFISRDGSSILNIFDTHPNDRMVSYYLSPELTASLTAGQTAWKVKRAIRLEDIGAPTLINDLSPYKKPELLRNPLGKGIPFLAHNSLARLPLFVMEPFVFVINFWADVIHAFPPGCMELLRELVWGGSWEKRWQAPVRTCGKVNCRHGPVRSGTARLRMAEENRSLRKSSAPFWISTSSSSKAAPACAACAN